MGLERYVVDAVLIEKRSPTEIARAHGISRSWLYALIARVKGGGYQALEPHSRRPRSCPREVGEPVVATVLQLRQELVAAGHDAGPQTIAHHLAGRVTPSPPSRTTIWRILRRRGLITPQPHKRPRSSFVRFEASLPNERWQADATDWHLAEGAKVEILNFVDDHSRLFVASVALDGRTPVQAFAARLKAGPAAELASVQYRVRHDRIDKTGTVTLRYRSRLRHIRVGADHRDKSVHIFVAGAEVRVVTEEGELLRALTIDPTRDYQPLNGRWPVHNVVRQASGMS